MAVLHPPGLASGEKASGTQGPGAPACMVYSAYKLLINAMLQHCMQTGIIEILHVDSPKYS